MKNLTIEITDKCSLNCVHCSTNSKTKNRFISLGDLNNILDEFQDFEIVRLSGGEPFEHPKLVEMLKEIRERGKQVIILSSGVYNEQEIPKEILAQIKEYVNIIIFSIYGVNGTHNQICNFQKAFDSLKMSINNARDLKIPFSFQTVAMKSTVKSMEEIVNFIQKIKKEVSYCFPKLHIFRFIKQGRGKINQEQSLSKEEIKELIKKTKELSKACSLKVTLGCSLKEEGCIAETGKAAVTINGEKIQCSALKYGAKQGTFACKERW